MCRAGASSDGPPPPAPPRKGEGSGEACASFCVDFRAVCAAEKSARRSHELSAGGCSPVCDPTPAVPFAIPGLSSFSSAGAIGASGSRAALARVGRAGSFGFFGSGDLAMRRIWAGKTDEGRATVHTRITIGFRRLRDSGPHRRVAQVTRRCGIVHPEVAKVWKLV